MAAQMISQTLKRKRYELTLRDYFFSGSLMALTGGLLTVSLGFGVGSLQYGVPRMPENLAKGRTPEELEPKVVKENRVLDLMQVQRMPRPFLRQLGRLNAFGAQRKSR
eukprot:CAMPEP_0114696104 /NCGR_PEP_ID=MMETSP0191-20121206/72140_1 /TAXON_ID=126664 /ORGANISM="Sorites sp." /LENGTH=107 /DNA_ID=CAMNT_0001993245 /DNA_START=128 /DNA_END=448 /DNA_ORIENTATION=+